MLKLCEELTKEEWLRFKISGIVDEALRSKKEQKETGQTQPEPESQELPF